MKSNSIGPEGPGPAGAHSTNHWENCHRRMTKGVVSISQGLGRREMEYTPPATAVQEPNLQGDGDWNTANRSGIPGTTSLQVCGPHDQNPIFL